MVSWQMVQPVHIDRYRQMEDNDARIAYAGRLAATWTFRDAETGRRLPCGDVGNLSLEQCRALVQQFERDFLTDD